MKKLLTVLFCVIIINACNSAENQEELFRLIDTTWILESIDGQQPIVERKISLQISTGYFSGSAGCNRYSAKYKVVSSNRFSIGELEKTAADCSEPEGVMEQEDHYTELLSSATTFQIVGQDLLLMDRQGQVILGYQAGQEFDVTPDSLIGKTWRLTSATNLGEVQFSDFTITFDDGEYRGTTICRDFEGEYQVEKDSFQITLMSMTTDYNCSEQDGHAEAQYTTLLENVEQYNVTLGQLELFTRHGQKLIFELAEEDK